MALKACKECGHGVSTKADTCPNCGVKNPTGGTFWIKAILWIIIIGFFYALFTSGDGDESNLNPSADKFSTLSLNVREGPSTEHDVITSLKPGEQVRVIKDSLGWNLIQMIDREGYETGWASNKYLSDVSNYDTWKEESSERASESETNTQTRKQEVNWEPVLNAIEQSKETGFLTRIENVDRTVYVNPLIWRSVDAETKENAVLTFARYLGYLNDMDQAVGIYVKDSQSGKTLAEYGVFSGVEIK